MLHALGERDDWEDLTVSGALLTDLYTLFTNDNVRFLSGFVGPIERKDGDAGHNVGFGRTPTARRRMRLLRRDRPIGQ